MTVYSNVERFKRAWDREYGKLAMVYSSFLPGRAGIIVEVGCGRGQLTIPLARVAPGYRFMAVDSYPGPYSKYAKSLEKKLSRDRQLQQRIELIVADGVKWLSKQPGSTFDAATSSEFLCEIDSNEMQNYIADCYRVLRAGGVCIQSFLSPTARNHRQRLLIEANSDPRWTRFVPKQWFSPPPSLVSRQMRDSGFALVHMFTMTSGIVVKAEAARNTLRSWHVRRAFWKHHEEELVSTGLEFPDWAVVVGQKAPRDFSKKARSIP